MTVDTFLLFCIDESILKVDIFSCEQQKVVWSGRGDDVPDEYRHADVCTWDIPMQKGHMTFNID